MLLDLLLLIADAPPPCGRNADLTKELLATYGEAPTAWGIQDSGTLLQVFTSPTGSWSIVLTTPAGLACIMAAGRRWETVAPRIEGPAI